MSVPTFEEQALSRAREAHRRARMALESLEGALPGRTGTDAVRVLKARVRLSAAVGTLAAAIDHLEALAGLEAGARTFPVEDDHRD